MQPQTYQAHALLSAAGRYFGLTRTGEHRRSSWGVLKNKRFRRYFIGCTASDFGTWIQNTAQVLLAYRLTHSVIGVALVACAQFSSPLVLGPWAGVLTDRFGGRRTLLCTEFGSAVIAATLAVLQFTGQLNQPWLVAGAIGIGLGFTFALPARNVTVRRLVPPDKIRAGFAMDSVSYNLGRALAPPLGVAICATLGFGYAFAFNALSFLLFTVVLAFVGRGTAEPERRSRIMDGFAIARREGNIAVVLLMVAAITIVSDPIQVLGPALATHVFHLSANWSGYFIAALGAGSVIGSFLPAKRTPSLRLAATVLAALGLCMLCFALAPVAWISVAAAFGAGVMCLIANSVTRTLLARQAGPAHEAAVMAIWAIAWAGSKPLTSVLDGLLAGSVGVRWTGVLLAAPAIVPVLVLIFLPGLGHRLAGPHPRRLATVGQTVAVS